MSRSAFYDCLERPAKIISEQDVVTQRQAYKVTTKRKHSASVADNLLNQQFNPAQANLVWQVMQHI